MSYYKHMQELGKGLVIGESVHFTHKLHRKTNLGMGTVGQRWVLLRDPQMIIGVPPTLSWLLPDEKRTGQSRQIRYYILIHQFIFYPEDENSLGKYKKQSDMFEMTRWWSSVEQVEIVEWNVCQEACSLKKELREENQGRKNGKRGH